MAEGEGRPEAAEGEIRPVGEALEREVRMALVVLDPVKEDFPSEARALAEVRASKTYGNELFRNWSDEHELDRALKAEIHRQREAALASRQRARDMFKEPTGKTEPPPNPYV